MLLHYYSMTQTICIRISSEHIEYLKKLSHQKSLDQGIEIKYTDLIRDAIREKYPIGGN